MVKLSGQYWKKRKILYQPVLKNLDRFVNENIKIVSFIKWSSFLVKIETWRPNFVEAPRCRRWPSRGRGSWGRRTCRRRRWRKWFLPSWNFLKFFIHIPYFNHGQSYHFSRVIFRLMWSKKSFPNSHMMTLSRVLWDLNSEKIRFTTTP